MTMKSRSDNATLPVFQPAAVDDKTTAERAWRAPLKPPAPQEPCDAGLFSDDRLQKDLF